MQNMSRKAKYEKLRQELQNDAESQISTKGISAYAERLSRLDTTATEQLEVKEEENHDPIHLRREATISDLTITVRTSHTAVQCNAIYFLSKLGFQCIVKRVVALLSPHIRLNP